VLVTAFDEPLMWQQARGVHCDAVLVKPITSSALHDALVRVLRRSGAAPVPVDTGRDEAEELLRARHAGQRLLLAEDNPINREVALELLTSAGLVVEGAADGLQAAELAASRHYDLVLMDVQMPELDGLEATRRIRRRLGPALPIVAMTANAFGEDRQACLAAGMNDHLAKPVDPKRLFTTLLRWLPLHGTVPASATPAPRPEERSLATRLADVEGLDIAEAMRHTGEREGTLVRAFEVFVQTYREGVPALAGRAGADTLQRWRNAVHSLRGACLALGFTPLAQRLLQFEQQIAAESDAAAAAPLAEALHEEVRRLVVALDEALRPALGH
jgi:CheY-like chemotaxis protein